MSGTVTTPADWDAIMADTWLDDHMARPVPCLRCTHTIASLIVDDEEKWVEHFRVFSCWVRKGRPNTACYHCSEAHFIEFDLDALIPSVRRFAKRVWETAEIYLAACSAPCNPRATPETADQTAPEAADQTARRIARQVAREIHRTACDEWNTCYMKFTERLGYDLFSPIAIKETAIICLKRLRDSEWTYEPEGSGAPDERSVLSMLEQVREVQGDLRAGLNELQRQGLARWGVLASHQRYITRQLDSIQERVKMASPDK
ncbi:hypothetical protein B0T22DRAFT_511833 [Podospora appendiculata]|uniref:Uncharacterized protein n=1 Tax=Podospora appendiculata TaxID=314037 RepID=A0AAE0X981_9PEZI|nr:hypothetical protein B0T22DRAFT_511833 [Podospora appendiculata]